MAHGPETDRLIEHVQSWLAGQDWINEALSDDDKSAIEMAVFCLVGMASREEPLFVAAVEAFRRTGRVPGS